MICLRQVQPRKLKILAAPAVMKRDPTKPLNSPLHPPTLRALAKLATDPLNQFGWTWRGLTITGSKTWEEPQVSKWKIVMSLPSSLRNLSRPLLRKKQHATNPAPMWLWSPSWGSWNHTTPICIKGPRGRPWQRYCRHLTPSQTSSMRPSP